MSEDLVRRARDGDADAFADLVLPRFASLYGLARVVAGDHHVAQDALQDALTRAWIELPRLRQPAAFDAWLRRLVINACRSEWRRRRRKPTERLDAIGEPAVESDPVRDVELRDELHRGLSLLTPDERAALALRYYADLSTEIGAAVMGVGSATYRSRVHRAVRALKRALDADRAAPPSESGSVHEV